MASRVKPTWEVRRRFTAIYEMFEQHKIQFRTGGRNSGTATSNDIS